jgi:hypothetical protein
MTIASGPCTSFAVFASKSFPAMTTTRFLVADVADEALEATSPAGDEGVDAIAGEFAAGGVSLDGAEDRAPRGELAPSGAPPRVETQEANDPSPTSTSARAIFMRAF